MTIEDRLQTDEFIESQIDGELMELLDEFIGEQKVSRAAVVATLCMLIANDLYSSHPDEEAACLLARGYGNFIHDSVHALYAEYGPPTDEVGEKVH